MKGKGIFQIVIGAAISSTSYVINEKANNNKFFLFMIAGLIFLGYGLIKFGFYMITKPKKEKKEPKIKIKESKFENKKVIHPHEVKQLKNNNSPFHTHHETIIACHSCNTKHYNSANFCQMCGTRFR